MTRSLASLILMLVAAAPFPFDRRAEPISPNSKLRTRVFEFSYKAVLPGMPQGAKRLSVWLPYPTSDTNQEISDIHISSPAPAVVYNEPRFGNSILNVSLEAGAPSPIEITITFKVRRTEHLRRDFRTASPHYAKLDPEIEQYLRPDKLVPVDGQIAQWASEVTKGKKTDLEKARAIYEYTVATLKYDKSGTGWGRGDIFYACDAKRGNCTDFHAVFIGFCRAAGIPARFAIGFPLPEKRGYGEIAGYHCWAEFYLSGYGWVPVDASEAWKQPERREYFFGGHDENRVQFSLGRDLVLRPRQHGAPLNYFIYPYAEADGTPVENIKREFRFKDISDEVSTDASRR